jgi:hypothetical protein
MGPPRPPPSADQQASRSRLSSGRRYDGGVDYAWISIFGPDPDVRRMPSAGRGRRVAPRRRGTGCDPCAGQQPCRSGRTRSAPTHPGPRGLGASGSGLRGTGTSSASVRTGTACGRSGRSRRGERVRCGGEIVARRRSDARRTTGSSRARKHSRPSGIPQEMKINGQSMKRQR